MTNTDTLISQIKNTQKEIASKKEELKQASQEALEKVIASVFEEYGDILAAISWTQYTPYFNDGDTCEFRVGEICLQAVGDDTDDEDWYYYESSPEFTNWASRYPEDSDRNGSGISKIAKEIRIYEVDNSTSWRRYNQIGTEPNPHYDQRYADCAKKVREIFNLIDEDTMYDTYGDHAAIRITKNGSEVDDYEHG